MVKHNKAVTADPLCAAFMDIQNYDEAAAFADEHPELMSRADALIHRLAASQSPDHALVLLRVLLSKDKSLLNHRDSLNRVPIEHVRSHSIAEYLLAQNPSHRARALRSALHHDMVEVVDVFWGKEDLQGRVKLCLTHNAVKILDEQLTCAVDKAGLNSYEVWPHAKTRPVAETLLAHDIIPGDSAQGLNCEVLEVVFTALPAGAVVLRPADALRCLTAWSPEAALKAIEVLDADKFTAEILEQLAALNRSDLIASILATKSPSAEAVTAGAIMAARHGSVDTLEIIVEKHPVLNAPLCAAACEFSQLEILRILEKCRIPFTTLTASDESALHVLARSAGDAVGNHRPPADFRQVAEEVLSRTIHLIDHPERHRRDTALHVAVRESNWVFAEILIRHGANETLQNSDGLTPQQIAAKQDSHALYLSHCSR